MSLARLQKDFLGAVLGPTPPAEPGLGAYHRNALAARREALAATHPVVRRLVGAAFFDEAAECFARANPSRSGDLHDYGRGFPGFIAGYAPARSIACLADMARLEWAVHECLHASDGAPLDHAALATLPPAQLAGLRLLLHPAVRRIASQHPILAIWEANQPDRDGTPDRREGPDRVLIRRVGLAAAPVLVDPEAWTLLEAFANGAELARACEALGRDEAFGPALARLAAWGAFGGLAPAAS